jgi:hypothetical protein
MDTIGRTGLVRPSPVGSGNPCVFVLFASFFTNRHKADGVTKCGFNLYTATRQPTINGMDEPNYRFTLRSLLGVVTIICVLLGLIPPMIQSAREASRRSSCANNLKQHGLGIHNYASTYRDHLPPGMTGDDTNEYGWGVYLVPFMESSTLYVEMIAAGMQLDFPPRDNRSGIARSPRLTAKEVRVDANLVSPSTGFVLVKRVHSTFLCPSSVLPIHDNDGYGAADYCGNAGNAFADYGCGAFKGEQQNGIFLFANDNTWTEIVRISDITDGTANVIAIGEVGASQDVSATKLSDGNFPIWAGGNNDGGCSAWNMGSCLRLCDREFTFNRRDGRESNLSFGSNHPSGVNVCLADASVRLLSHKTDPDVLHKLGARNDGEEIDLDHE